MNTFELLLTRKCKTIIFLHSGIITLVYVKDVTDVSDITQAGRVKAGFILTVLTGSRAPSSVI